jgi:hypothetical protein
VVLAACNALARVCLGAHNPLDVVGGAAIGLAIAALLDMILDVARDRGRPLWQHVPAPGRPGPTQEAVNRATAQVGTHIVRTSGARYSGGPAPAKLQVINHQELLAAKEWRPDRLLIRAGTPTTAGRSASTPAVSSIASSSGPSKSRTRTAQPPMYGMDNQRSIAVRIVLLCNSLPPPSV